MHTRPGHLVLEDGTVFTGMSVGGSGVTAGEACFTTAMAGYEETVTDPSYVAQVLCFAYPLIGTYGVDEARMESERIQCEGVVMRDVRPAVNAVCQALAASWSLPAAAKDAARNARGAVLSPSGSIACTGVRSAT